MGRFEGKVAFITGGASGIGRATALAFAREGATVVITTDKNIKGAEETVGEIEALGGKAHFIRCDVRKEEDVKAAIEEVRDRFGGLDYAFNNAGVGPDGVRIPVMEVDECTEEVWDHILDVNLKGVFFSMKYEMRIMKAQRSGVIVNNASVGALKPIPGFGAYAASKAGVILLSKTAALEGAPFGIRVNVVCPGLTAKTGLSDNILKADPQKKEEMLRFVPLGRMADPDEIARAVLWLCSDEASFITGHVMPIDGGLSAT